MSLQLLKTYAVPDPFTKVLYCIALFAKVYVALCVGFCGLHLGALRAFTEWQGLKGTSVGEGCMPPSDLSFNLNCVISLP